MHGATSDATQSGDGERVEDEPGRRQDRERHEAKGVRTRTAASRAPVETGTGSTLRRVGDAGVVPVGAHSCAG